MKSFKLEQRLFEEAVTLRRRLHQYPELGYQEHQTAALIHAFLLELGLEVEAGIAQTGVVAILRGDQPGPILALRADMDALPIQEPRQSPYASENPGVMHACGHDMHTAMLLMTAKALAGRRNEIRGSIKFIFQPAEEVLGGGKAMVECGVLLNPEVDHIFGMHVWPDLPTGVVGFRDKAIMASMDAFHVVLSGKQAHGAAPQLGIDAIVAAANIVNGLQTIVSRETSPLEPVVITIGTIEAGQAVNIIPEKASFKGTVRTLNEDTRRRVAGSVERIIVGMSEALRVVPEIQYEFAYPATINETQFTRYAAALAGEQFGENGVRWLKYPSLASEDFAYYLEKIPGTFAFLGVGGTTPGSMRLHSEVFMPDEEAMRQGIELFVAMGLKYGHQHM